MNEIVSHLLSALCELNESHERQSSDIASLKREVKVKADVIEQASKAKTSNQLIVNATGEVASLKKKLAETECVHAEHEQRANTTIEQLNDTCKERARIIRAMVQWASGNLQSDDVVTLKRIAGEPT